MMEASDNLEKFGKFSLAILEHFVKEKLGDEAIEMLKGKYKDHEYLIQALASAEGQYRQDHGDWAPLLFEQEIDETPTLEEAYQKFHKNPTDRALQNTLVAALKRKTDPGQHEILPEVVQEYIRLFKIHLAFADEAFRENLNIVSQLDQQDYQAEQTQVQRKILDTIAQQQGEKEEQGLPLSKYLPRPPKDFTGREDDLKELRLKIAEYGAVNIRGMGGSGKTALARQIAQEYRGCVS